MKQRILFSLLAALFPWSPAVQAGKPAQISRGARAVLERAIESAGGESALAGIKSMRIHSRGTYKMGSMESPYSTIATYVAPDRILWELDAGMFKGAVGLHGETAWSSMMTPPARAAGAMKKNILEWPIQYQIWLLHPILSLEGTSVREGKKVEREGKAERRVRIQIPNGHKIVLTFAGEEAIYLSAMEGDYTHWDGREGEMKSTFAKPKKFGTVTLPSFTRSQTFANGKIQESMQEEITRIEWNPEVPESTFHMPKLDIALMKTSVKQAPAFQGLLLLHKGPYERLGETIQKVYGAAGELGLMPAGALTAVYLNNPMEVSDPSGLRTEVALPVMIPGPPPEKLPGGMSLKSYPEVEVASMTARGPYGDADVKALHQLFEWIPKNGYSPAGTPRTLFHHHPAGTVPEDQISEVQIPVKKK